MEAGAGFIWRVQAETKPQRTLPNGVTKPTLKCLAT
jgi:hypothetical protein